VAVLCALVGGLAGVAFASAAPAADTADTAAADRAADAAAGARLPNLPVYTAAEVAAHKQASSRIWVSFREGVYDVTDFVAMHPGGNKILLAAGGPVDAFWSVYAQHRHAHVYELLEKHRIGNLAEADVAAARAKEAAATASGASSDPYGREPLRHPALIPRSAKPFNAEPPAQLLADSYITPTELFFVRNHLPVPDIDPATYALEISGPGIPEGAPVRLSLHDLQTKFPQHTVVTALQCAGNRRQAMTDSKATRGLGWGVAAMANAEWRGPLMRDVLLYAGLREEDVGRGLNHLQFEGLDRDPVASTVYAASIPADKGFDPRGEAILALELNGAPITRDHGYPVRAVVPGIVGARQVKWLGKIVASAQESDSLWQVKDYKAFPPTMDWDTVDFMSMPAIQDMPVASAICEPAEGTALLPGARQVSVKGWAWSGGGRAITRVDVSADGGKTWVVADIVAAPEDPTPSQTRHWGWSLWQADVPLPAPAAEGDGAVQLVCKAMDVACNTQPEEALAIWNFRGLANNSWHRVNVTVPPASTKMA
jgi:sulfite oxidase